jgi:hypothetical protein
VRDDQGYTFNCADTFEHEFRRVGYAGKIYAYKAPVKVDGRGHKYIPDFETSQLFGREMYNLAKDAKVELNEPEMNAAAQAAGDDKVGTTIENRDFTFAAVISASPSVS